MYLSDEALSEYRRDLGLDEVAESFMHFGGAVFDLGGGTLASQPPLPELIAAYLLVGGQLEPLVEALHPRPGIGRVGQDEKAPREHPDVAEAVAIGVVDEYRGESVKAFVVRRAGASTTEEEVLAFCKERLSAYKTPKAVEFREELPKSTVGKFLRRVLVEEERAKAEARPQS